MKIRIVTVLFIPLLFSAKISPAAAMEEAQDLPMLSAIHENKPLEHVKSLIENNADVNEKNKEGYTALMLATEKNKLNIVSLLLEKNADVNERIPGGHSAWSLAANQEIRAVLEEHGAKDPNLIQLLPGYKIFSDGAGKDYIYIPEYILEDEN